ncbi:MAG: ATP-binding protein [Tenericutes bacterium]|nr:ATP-binding protein [Mycoplasmatota bacterium]
MINSSNFVKKSKKAINDELRRNFVLASSDDTFKKLCNRLKLDEEILMKYTSKLMDSSSELKNCSKCKGLGYCKNTVKGHVYFPTVTKDFIEFSYKSCKYYKESTKKNNTTFFETSKMLMSASLSDLINEKERTIIIKYIKDFLTKKVKNEPVKGLYLSGSFGSGKSYILSALLNELSNKGFKCVNINYPLLLNKLKAAFNDYNYNEVLEEIMTSDILLIDDIGAENNSVWARDEVLGTILQYRMDCDLTTFFTSNFTIDQLENELSETNKGSDQIKARRIIERIKYLTIEEKLISKNKR